jgi:shikimate dehydrogenase
MSTKLSPQRRVGLIGWPVAHSVSPAMHNAAFKALDMDWRYELLPTLPEAVEERVAGLRMPEFAGANVTIPHKQAVIPFLDRVMDAAAVVGAVNTIVATDDRLTGYNTDIAGIHWALQRHQVEPAGWHVVVLGAGGAARACLYALSTLGVASISVFNRTPERAERLIEDLRPHLGTMNVGAAPLGDVGRLEATLARAHLLVNTTSVGMHPNVDPSPLPDGVDLPAHILVFDMVYNPQHTQLLRQAERTGARTIGGLDMLIGQGVEAFKLWTGCLPPADLMQQAALAWLEVH